MSISNESVSNGRAPASAVVTLGIVELAGGLISSILLLIVGHPDEVEVEASHGPESTAFEVRLHPIDLDYLNRDSGRLAQSLDNIVGEIGLQIGRPFPVSFVSFRNEMSKSIDAERG